MTVQRMRFRTAADFGRPSGSYSGLVHTLVGAPTVGLGIGTVDMAAMTGDVVRLSFFAKDLSAGGPSTVSVAVKSYASNGSLIGTVCTGSVQTNVWTLVTATGTVPANCYLLAIEVTASSADSYIDHADVIVGDLVDATAFAAPFTLDCESLAPWTVVSGTWVLDSANELVGTHCIRCSAAGTIQQAKTLPTTHDDLGDRVWFSAFLRRTQADDAITLYADILDSGLGQLASTGRAIPVSAVGEWVRVEGELDIPSGATGGSLRLRAVATVGSGSAGPMLDAIQAIVCNP